MANTIKIKRSSVSGKVPTIGDLQLGELALNTYDGKLYSKKDGGSGDSIFRIGGFVDSLLTFDNSGSGDASGTSFDGAVSRTISFNSIGAASSTHSHGNISNSGAIGITANLPIITTTNGVLTTGTFGTTSNTFCQGNDSRLSDTRNTTNNVTFNSNGAGGTSGLTFNGSSAVTVSYNTLGAQPTLVSGTNIKTINGSSLLGSGDLTISGGGGGAEIPITDDTTSEGTKFLLFGESTSGNVSSVNTSSTKLTFKPSTGNLSATSFSSLSDERQKKNIRVVEDPLSIIKKLRGVRYEMKKFPCESSIGVVAQEVEVVLPEVVFTDSYGMKSVSYGNIVGLLIEAIKEQQILIDRIMEYTDAK